MKRTLVVLGVLVLAFGVSSLHYTAPGGDEHHAEWAQEHGLPAPTREIFFLGLGTTVVGAGLAGLGLGRPRKR